MKTILIDKLNNKLKIFFDVQANCIENKNYLVTSDIVLIRNMKYIMKFYIYCNIDFCCKSK